MNQLLSGPKANGRGLTKNIESFWFCVGLPLFLLHYLPDDGIWIDRKLVGSAGAI
jgi:hypothetical protein